MNQFCGTCNRGGESGQGRDRLDPMLQLINMITLGGCVLTKLLQAIIDKEWTGGALAPCRLEDGDKPGKHRKIGE